MDKKLIYLFNQEIDLLEIMIEEIENEVNMFHMFTSEEIFQLSNDKNEELENLIFVKNEIKEYIDSHSIDITTVDYQHYVNKIENISKIFVEENTKLMVMTTSMQKLYDDVIDGIDDKSIINIDI